MAWLATCPHPTDKRVLLFKYLDAGQQINAVIGLLHLVLNVQNVDHRHLLQELAQSASSSALDTFH